MMPIISLDNKSIDKEKWDSCVRNSISGNVYAMSWYLDIVSKNWNALITEDYSSVFPLTWRKKMGIRYLCQPPFTQQLGLISKEILKHENLKIFLNSIPKDYKLIEINLNKYNKEIPDTFFRAENNTYELALDKPYEAIIKEYSENTRRNLKKAQKNGMLLSKNISADDLINLFRKNKGRQIDSLHNSDYEILRQIINQSLYNNYGELWGAFDSNNSLCAAAFFIEGNGKAIFLFSAINEDGRNNSAMFCIIDNYIKTNAGKSVVLDFEGSNDENLAHFYKGFGSKKYSYFHLQSNKLPYLVNLFRIYYKNLKFS